MPTYKNTSDKNQIVSGISFKPQETISIGVYLRIPENSAIQLISKTPYPFNPIISDEDYEGNQGDTIIIDTPQNLLKLKLYVYSGAITIYRDSLDNVPGYRMFDKEILEIAEVDRMFDTVIIKFTENSSKVRIVQFRKVLEC